MMTKRIFCLDTLAGDGAVLFHDAPVTYNGIEQCLRHLEKIARRYRAYSLPNVIFVVELGDFSMHRNSAVLDRLTNNHASYIYSLQSNDYYRKFANKALFRLYRRAVAKWKGLNKFE